MQKLQAKLALASTNVGTLVCWSAEVTETVERKRVDVVALYVLSGKVVAVISIYEPQSGRSEEDKRFL